MRQPVMQTGDRARIADQDLVDTPGGGIAKERSLHVAVHQLPDFAQGRAEQSYDGRRLTAVERCAGLVLPIAEFSHDLAFQVGQGSQQLGRHETILLDRRAAEPTQAARVEG